MLAGRGTRDGDRVALAPTDRRIEVRLFTKKRVFGGIVALGTVVILTQVFLKYGVTRTLTVAGARVSISEVKYDDFREFIPLNGTVAPRTTVYIDAIEGGQITGVFVEEGAIVEAGQRLVSLKNTSLQLEVVGREAQLAEQLNNLSVTRLMFEQNRLNHERELLQIDYEIDTARRHLKQRTPLVQSGGVTHAELKDIESRIAHFQGLRLAIVTAQDVDEKLQVSQIKQLSEAISAIKATLAVARQSLVNLSVKAPISGQLTFLEANIGATKQPGETIGQIDEPEGFKIEALIDEYYISRVAVGQKANAKVDGTEYELEVTKIYPRVLDRQFRIDMRFTVEAPTEIRRGQTIRVQLEVGASSKSLVVENGAFYSESGGNWVYVLSTSNDLARRRNVQFGRRNSDLIEVLDGLTEGERVITSSYRGFSDFEIIELDSAE